MYSYSLVRILLRMTMTTTRSTSPSTLRPRRTARTRVAIVGATGYAGQELVRLLARHPAVTLTLATASQATSTPRRLPALARIWDGEVAPLDLDAVSAQADVAFLALPEAASAEIAPPLLEAGLRVVDLSGAFRLRDAARARAVVSGDAGDAGRRGLRADGVRARGDRDARGSSRIRAAIRRRRCWRCCRSRAPACSPPASDIVIDAKSGISGAGKAPSERTHFSENHGSVAAYGAFGHRHTPEMEQALGRQVTFVPHLVPLDRGLLSSIYVRLRAGHDRRRRSPRRSSARTRRRRSCGSPAATCPRSSTWPGRNFCDIGWKVDEATGRVLIVSVIDNLLKGAAGSAVQNFNVMAGLDERTGLL